MNFLNSHAILISSSSSLYYYNYLTIIFSSILYNNNLNLSASPETYSGKDDSNLRLTPYYECVCVYVLTIVSIVLIIHSFKLKFN